MHQPSTYTTQVIHLPQLTSLPSSLLLGQSVSQPLARTHSHHSPASFTHTPPHAHTHTASTRHTPPHSVSQVSQPLAHTPSLIYCNSVSNSISNSISHTIYWLIVVLLLCHLYRRHAPTNTALVDCCVMACLLLKVLVL